MSILSDLNPLGIIGDIGSKLIDHFFPDPQKAKEAKLELLKMQQSGEFKRIDAYTTLVQAQTDINAKEAASGNLFVAGARPFLLWVCGAAFAWQFVLEPIASWSAAALGHPVQLPSLDMSQMMPVLLGLLGLGGYRTVEKIKGVNGRHG